MEANFDKDKSQHSYKTPQGQKLLAWLQDNCTAMVKGFTTKYTGFNKGRSGIRRNHGVYFCTYPRCGKCWVSFTGPSLCVCGECVCVCGYVRARRVTEA